VRPGVVTATGAMDLVATVGALGEDEVPTSPVPGRGQLLQRPADTQAWLVLNHRSLIGLRDIELERPTTCRRAETGAFSGHPAMPMNSSMMNRNRRDGLQEVRSGRGRARVRTGGEEATADVVAGWRRRRKGWRLLNGIYIAGHGDIDHVLVGPGGVFVIQSKWTSHPCRIECGEIVGLLGRVPVAQAGNAAVKVERLLHRRHQQFDIEVQPVVVIWGSGGLELDQGSTDIDGVLVCEGRRHREWVRRLDGAAHLSPTSVDAITRTVEEQLVGQLDPAVPTAVTWWQRTGSLLPTR
jgi:Nuclease-related domain